MPAGRCTAKTKSGKRCSRRAKKGNRCLQHPLKKMGRPLIVWDKKQWKQFDSFCAAHESRKDIAEAMGLDDKTIDAICRREKGSTFSEYAQQRRGLGKALVAGKQLQVALGGDVQMLKHLGKYWLGQKDHQHGIEITGPTTTGITVRFAPSPADEKDEAND